MGNKTSSEKNNSSSSESNDSTGEHVLGMEVAVSSQSREHGMEVAVYSQRRERKTWSELQADITTYKRLTKDILEWMNAMVKSLENHQVAVRASKTTGAVLGVAAVPFYFIPPLWGVGLGLGIAAGVTSAGASVGDGVRTHLEGKAMQDKVKEYENIRKQLKDKIGMAARTSDNMKTFFIGLSGGGVFGVIGGLGSLIDDAIGVTGGVAGRALGGAFGGIGAGIGIVDAIYALAKTNEGLKNAREIVKYLEEEIKEVKKIKKAFMDETMRRLQKYEDETFERNDFEEFKEIEEMSIDE